MLLDGILCECGEYFPVVGIHGDPRPDWAKHLDNVLEDNK